MAASPPRNRSRSDPARTKRRQREIIDAAAEIFHRKGYSETSVQDIAEAVGILKGSLYYYIESKEDLLYQLAQEVHAGGKAVVEEVAALDLAALAKLRAYIERQVVYEVENLSKIAVYYHDYGLLSARRKRAILDQRRYYNEFVCGLVEAAKQEGAISAAADTGLVANAVFGMLNWIYTWYRSADDVNPEYLGALYAELIIGGLVNDALPAPPPPPRKAAKPARGKAPARRSKRA